MEIYYSYTKLRKEFGRHCAFHDEAGEVRSRAGLGQLRRRRCGLPAPPLRRARRALVG